MRRDAQIWCVPALDVCLWGQRLWGINSSGAQRWLWGPSCPSFCHKNGVCWRRSVWDWRIMADWINTDLSPPILRICCVGRYLPTAMSSFPGTWATNGGRNEAKQNWSLNSGYNLFLKMPGNPTYRLHRDIESSYREIYILGDIVVRGSTLDTRHSNQLAESHSVPIRIPFLVGLSSNIPSNMAEWQQLTDPTERSESLWRLISRNIGQ